MPTDFIAFYKGVASLLRQPSIKAVLNGPQESAHIPHQQPLQHIWQRPPRTCEHQTLGRPRGGHIDLARVFEHQLLALFVRKTQAVFFLEQRIQPHQEDDGAFQAGAEVAFDPGDAGGQGLIAELGLEMLSVLRVVVPAPAQAVY
jgi:hypothetical protein